MSSDINEHKEIVSFGIELMKVDNIDAILELISAKLKELLHVDRCSIFVVDDENKMLWTKLSDGIEMIVVPNDIGIVGDTYKTQKVQLVNAPYEDERFMRDIDNKRGYRTKNIISVPVFNSQKRVIAVIELLNKFDADFDEKDSDTLVFFANFVSGSLELMLMDDWFN